MKQNIVSLADIADINPRSRSWSSLPDETKVTFVPMPSISEFTASIVVAEVRSLGDVRRGYTPFQEKDVLFAKITPCMENGKAALAKDLINGLGFGSTEFHVLRAKEIALPEYIYYFIRQPSFRNAAKQRMSGAVGQQRVPADFLKNYAIPLPTISEQRRIVEILDQADALRKKRAEADEKSDRILSAIFIKMFGDPSTNPRRWKVDRLDQFVEIGTSLVDPNQSRFENLAHVGGENIEKNNGRLLNIKSVKESDLRSGKFTFTEDHILYCKIRPYLNKVAYPRFSGVCSADIYPLLPRKGDLKHLYLISVLRSESFLKYAAIHSSRLRMPKLNKEELGSYPIMIPDLKLQEKFEIQAVEIEKINTSKSSSASKLDKLFKLLLHRAFSGDLTAEWRKAHMNEILQEMEHQAKVLGIPHTVEYKQLALSDLP